MLEIWILCIHLQYESPKINPISYAFFTVSARPGSNLDKERKKPYVLLAYPSTGERERGRQRNCDYQKTGTHFYLLQPTIPPLRGICKELAPKSLFLTCRKELGGSNIQNTSYEGLSFFPS
jgi:hypothetical protein